GLSRNVTIRASVDLPQPLSPTTASVRPGDTVNDTSLTAYSGTGRRSPTRTGYTRVKFSTASSVIAARGSAPRRRHAAATRGARRSDRTHSGTSVRTGSPRADRPHREQRPEWSRGGDACPQAPAARQAVPRCTDATVHSA